MNRSYFTPEASPLRLFYLQGRTSDVFYTDSCMSVNLKWLLYRELLRQGYERIVYYDADWKLYCYDDRSLKLLTETGEKREGEAAPAPQRAVVSGNGLRKGKWGKNRREAAEPSGTAPLGEPVSSRRMQEGGSVSSEKGKSSGISMLSVPETPLHTGMADDEMIFRQLDSYMEDPDIKTAVVIADASDFISRLGNAADRAHRLSSYQELPPENENIMIFIFPRQDMLSLLPVSQLDPKEIPRKENVIDITCPNALEIRNMLNYMRLFPGKRRGGKKIRLKMRVGQIQELALEIRRYMAEDEQDPIDNKKLYHKLMNFAESGKELTVENCCEIFGRRRHRTGEELLEELIGMENVKEEIWKFRRGNVKTEDQLRSLTSSRLIPDLPKPQNRDLMHVVLTGDPGTGKTTVAKLLGQIYFEMGYLSSGHVVEADRGRLVGEYVGSTAIKTQNRVKEALGGVLFVDEAYALIRSDNPSDGDFGREAVDTLVKAMDEYRGQFILVAAGYEKEMKRFLEANPGLASRFRLKLHLDSYTPEEMQRILERMVKDRGMDFSEEFRRKLPDFCENWVNLSGEGWGNAREASKLAADLELNLQNDPAARARETEEGPVRILEERHLPDALKEYLQPVSELRRQAMEHLESLTGLGGVKERIKKLQRGMLMGDRQEPGNYIFSGPPGTGKTTVARIMGQILRNHGLLTRGHTVEYTAGELVNEIRMGKNFEDIVRKALGGVLFIDEAYQLLETGLGQNIISSLVPCMENSRKELCVICAGYEEDMKRFLAYNDGLKHRFAEQILFESYSGEELQKILLQMLAAEGFRWDEEYAENSLRVLTRYVGIHKKDKDFGNARYLRSRYIPDSKDARNIRLLETYKEAAGDIPESEKKYLTGADIPADLVPYIREKLPEEKLPEDEKRLTGTP